MKQKLLLILFVFAAIRGFAQEATKVFSDVKDVTLRNVGVIKQNNVIKGYFNFYQFDKADKKNLIYKLNLVDENLNDLGTKEIIGPKAWELVSTGFDGKNFCFKFWDEKAKTIELKVYDQDANEVASSELKINYKPGSHDYKMYSDMTPPELYMLANNGFVDYTFNEPNNAFIISYVDGTSKTSWQKTYEPEGKSKVMLPTFLNGNSDVILTAVSRVEKGWNNGKSELSVLATSTKDGSQLFDMSTEIGDNHIVPINAVFEDGKITIIGLNYKSKKVYTTAPDGMAFLEVDKSGKLLKSNFKTFEESLSKYMPMEDHRLKDGYYLYIHDIVRTNHNTNIVVAEKFKKVADGMGIALAVLSQGNGGGVAKLKIENMVVIEYDMDGNVIQAKEVPKVSGNSGGFPQYVGLLQPYLLAFMANGWGWMDYMYTSKSDDNSEITFSFVDYDRLDADAKKTRNFGQIRYKNNQFTVDKFPIKNDKATFSHLFPAKTNHVLQVNYYKKEKKLSMDMIKLNN
ncbi:MAG: hypothetical protein JST50_16440 [Bacteroidetes bacterium]|jgi:hypothetical protein|nr:hypothetical protein [Bacteroidota bacterium]